MTSPAFLLQPEARARTSVWWTIVPWASHSSSMVAFNQNSFFIVTYM